MIGSQYLYLARRELSGRLGGKQAPLLAGFKVTHRCNLRCRGCPFWRRPGGDISFDTAIDAMDRLRQQLGDAVIVLAGASDGRAALVAAVSGSATGRVRAGDLVGFVAGAIGGKGGGRPDMAQAGGKDGPQLQQVLAEVPAWAAAKLSAA